MWKKRVQILLWCLLGCGCVVLLVAAIQVKNSKTCSGVQIDIDNNGEKIFINEKDIQEVLQANNAVKGIAIENIHLVLIEKELEKNVWIKDAQLFFDNNQVLTVRVAERQPVARIFTVDGSSFYIDTAGNKLPLSEKFSARLPVFTSYPSQKKLLTAADSIVVQDVKKLAGFIQQDSFWAAQVAQVDITPQHTYEISPVLGNQVIRIGNADDMEAKFKRLFIFYKKVWGKAGLEKYETIDVEYNGQIVAVRRGEAIPAADSLTAMQQLANGVANAGGVTSDTLYAGIARRNNTARDSTHVNHRVVAQPKPAAGRQVAANARKRKAPVKPVKGGKKKKAPVKRH